MVTQWLATGRFTLTVRAVKQSEITSIQLTLKTSRCASSYPDQSILVVPAKCESLRFMKTLHFPSKSALNWSGTTTKMENNNTEAVQCLLYLSNYFGFFTRFSFSSYKKVTFIRLQMQEQWIIYKCCWCVFACLLGAWVCLHPRTKQCPAPSTNNDIGVNPLLPSPFL